MVSYARYGADLILSCILEYLSLTLQAENHRADHRSAFIVLLVEEAQLMSRNWLEICQCDIVRPNKRAFRSVARDNSSCSDRVEPYFVLTCTVRPVKHNLLQLLIIWIGNLFNLINGRPLKQKVFLLPFVDVTLVRHKLPFTENRTLHLVFPGLVFNNILVEKGILFIFLLVFNLFSFFLVFLDLGL